MLSHLSKSNDEISPQTLRSRAPAKGGLRAPLTDILDYAKDDISNWRDFVAAAAVIRPMLGSSVSAWEKAQTVMGERQAATVVAAILQRGGPIASAGGVCAI